MLATCPGRQNTSDQPDTHWDETHSCLDKTGQMKLEFDFHSSSQIISPVGSAAVLAVESEIASVEDWPRGSWRFLTPRQLDESLVRVSDLLQSSTERHHKHGRICWRQI